MFLANRNDSIDLLLSSKYRKLYSRKTCSSFTLYVITGLYERD